MPNAVEPQAEGKALRPDAEAETVGRRGFYEYCAVENFPNGTGPFPGADSPSEIRRGHEAGTPAQAYTEDACERRVLHRHVSAAAQSQMMLEVQHFIDSGRLRGGCC